MYKIYPEPNAAPLEAYYELDIAGDSFTFLPQNLNLRSDAQQIVDSLFKDEKNMLLKLKKNVDGASGTP